MNICIINVDYQPEYIGGIKRVSCILAREWQSLGHTVVLLTLTPSNLKEDAINGIQQFFFPDFKTPNSDKNLNYFIDVIKNKKIDIVINQHIEEHDICKLCYKVKQITAIKLISTLHFSPTHKKDVTRNSFFIPYKSGNKIKRYTLDCLLFLKFWLYTNPINEKRESCYFNMIYSQSDKVVLLSNKYIPIFQKKAKITNLNKLIAINNPAIFTTNKQILQKEKIIVWCGRLGYDMKRTDKMLSIWKKISNKFPKWELKILGSGDVQYFKELIKRFNIPNVEIVGFTNPNDYYNKAEVLCMTSVTEGLPMVLIEAMTHKCIPVAFNSFASLTDIIKDGENGFIVTPYDENEYVRKLSELMKSASLRQKMAEDGVKSVSKFDSNKIADQWITLFKELLNN